MNDAPASVFSQINIDNEEVVFMQTDMSLANDSFFCTITNQDAIIYDQRFHVQVVPLVKEREPFKVSLNFSPKIILTFAQCQHIPETEIRIKCQVSMLNIFFELNFRLCLRRKLLFFSATWMPASCPD